MKDEVSQFYLDLKKTQAYLHFSDGKTFIGHINKDKSDPIVENGIWAEAAFTTGMSGYQETATDPSFLGQHIIFSSAHIGNYPSDERVNQSEKIHAACLIARNFSYNTFLAKSGVTLFSGTDTRSLVKYLVNNKGQHKSVLSLSNKAPSAREFEKHSLICNDLSQVTWPKKGHTIINEGPSPIVLINYGVKQAIVDQLKILNKPLVVVNAFTTSQEILALNPSLIFLSNGPGDPKEYTDQIDVIKELLKVKIPLRGICLGHQLLTIALGAKTIKLPFGQRGANHPVIDHVTGKILITSQNHGYASEESSLKDIFENNPLNKTIFISHTSLFDKSVEGIASTDSFLKSVQFHPEANPGPKDAHIFFREIANYLEGNKYTVKTENLFPLVDVHSPIIKTIPYKRILIVGSGPIKIGQASEFDYSGTQACKSLKSLGIDVILLNSNPATIMTDPEMATHTYIEPITKSTIKKIVEKENVDAVLSTMGGQTALNICLELEQENFFNERGIQLLGANVETIEKTEDRDLFSSELDTLGFKTGKRYHAHSKDEALLLANAKVGFPLIIRRSFALGGSGAALVYNDDDLCEIFNNTDIKFPVTMEKSLIGWKEIELEVMVDCEKNGVIICSIENIDPCGIHTGDSITVAPAQTISDRCYQNLRDMALKIAIHMGVVAGGANVQFAINPVDEDEIIVIEMNPRVSRSSALASKATGYPIAKISAMLAVGYTLKEILNDITQASPVAFEPTLDYVALKIPIFPFNKFPESSQILGPQMRSVGEVLALGSNFNEAFMKALRSLELGLEIPSLGQLKTTPFPITENYIRQRLKDTKELSLLTVLEALRLGIDASEIYSISKITPWFIEQMETFLHYERDLKENGERSAIDKDYLYNLKLNGFSDKYIAYLSGKTQKDILQSRITHSLKPVYKAVDTCSGEFNAQTPYFYSTYCGENEARPFTNNKETIVVMGSGPNRIGQGIEFDYSCVKSCMKIKQRSKNAVMVNSNPETVSTDYDSSDRLYLSPLYSEDLFDIFCHENPTGIVASFSGQTGIKIRGYIEKDFRKEIQTFNFLGSSLETLERTEDRKLFSEILQKVDISQTKSKEVRGHKQLLNAMTEIGLPVIIRPSYVIGGESMFIFKNFDDVNELPKPIIESLHKETALFQVETYLERAIEYDVDLIRDKEGNCIFTICEHIEYAGVHSGDSGMISPPVALTSQMYEKLKKISKEMAAELNVIGPINFQYAVKDEKVYCIEANPRGSRTLPFLSKAYNLDLPGVASSAMLGETIQPWDSETCDFFCVKQSTFPFDRFVQDNIILGPKMRSTGETFGIDKDKEMAILKSYLGNYPKLLGPGKIVISLADTSKQILLTYLKPLKRRGYEFVATPGTYKYIKKQGVECTLVSKLEDEKEDNISNIVQALKDEGVKMVFNTPMDSGNSKSDGEQIRNTAISYGIPCFTREENIKAVVECLIASTHNELIPVSLQYLHQKKMDNL
ncbi:MAG: carbamoyl-phosphate synthase large subunit [Halobacteriovoraceae bacterium]|nr:carbamoyl-phosphate synthase large subunit [Halobacteriovoraceae bacterium]